MRKTIFAIPLAFTLAGCATTGGGTASTDQVIGAIQQFTRQACGFLPAAQGVAAVIAALYPAGAPAFGIVDAVGNAICQAPVVAAAKRRYGAAAGVARVVVAPNGQRIIVRGAQQ